MWLGRRCWFCFFFFNDTATTEIYTLSLHDALPICLDAATLALTALAVVCAVAIGRPRSAIAPLLADRKSTRLNSSHGYISYAVFCLKKKKYETAPTPQHALQSPAASRARVQTLSIA